MSHHEKVILFPKWKTNLEEEGLSFLKAANYKKALEKFNQLVTYGVANDDILTGKLICLMELGMYDEAEEICLAEMSKSDHTNYYQYAHIYFTLLFQTNQYDVLLEKLYDELSFPGLPDTEKKQFQQLYEMSAAMKSDLDEKKNTAYIADLKEAVENDDIQKQWRTIDALRKMKLHPGSREIQLLQEEFIHPVVKTAVIEWLQATDSGDNIRIHKFGMQATIRPIEIPAVSEHPLVSAILSTYDDIEQKNPTLYQMLLKLLNHYAYVRFPFLPDLSDADEIAAATLYIGKKYLNLPVQDEVSVNMQNYLSEIELCDRLYASIIAE